MRDASIAVIRAVGVETGGSQHPVRHQPRQRRHGRHRDEPARVAVVGAGVARRRATRSPRSPPSWPSATRSTSCRTTSRSVRKCESRRATRSADGGRRAEPRQDGNAALGAGAVRAVHVSACFEPTIDYCVIKIPRWTFEKFPDADETLTTQMKSVGEAMAIGRTFKEALQKGIRSMEVKRFGFGLDKYDKWLNAQTGHSGTGDRPCRLQPNAWARRPCHGTAGQDHAGRERSTTNGRSPRTSSAASWPCRARAGCTTSATP